MNPHDEFKKEVQANIKAASNDKDLQALSRIWCREITPYKYAYNFSWMGRPIIQFPQDMIAMQEIIWLTKPDLVIETGVAHGGSILYYASLLELIGHGEVLGIDIDIRPHNLQAIETHPMGKRVKLMQGSSIAPEMIQKVREYAQEKRCLVVLDSNHTHEHVLAELLAYADLVCVGGYCVVMDTLVEDMPQRFFENGDRPWKVGDNPKTAVLEYIKTHPEFEIDKQIDHKLLISVAPDGYLKRVR